MGGSKASTQPLVHSSQTDGGDNQKGKSKKNMWVKIKIK